MGLELSGGVQLSAGFDFDLGFGVSRTQGVFLDTRKSNELQFTIDATLPDDWEIVPLISRGAIPGKKACPDASGRHATIKGIIWKRTEKMRVTACEKPCGPTCTHRSGALTYLYSEV